MENLLIAGIPGHLASSLEIEKGRQMLAAFAFSSGRWLIEHTLQALCKLIRQVAVWIQSANRFASDAMFINDYK